MGFENGNWKVHGALIWITSGFFITFNYEVHLFFFLLWPGFFFALSVAHPPALRRAARRARVWKTARYRPRVLRLHVPVRPRPCADAESARDAVDHQATEHLQAAEGRPAGGEVTRWWARSGLGVAPVHNPPPPAADPQVLLRH